MMKIAVFSDVHANLAALEAVLRDVEKRKADRVLCAGDLVGYGPFPNEVTEMIRNRHIPCVMGNYDDGIANSRLGCGCDYPDEQARILGERSIAWTKEHTSEENKQFLRFLPRKIRMETSGKRILVVHGSPTRLNEYLGKDTPEDYLRSVVEEEGVDVLISGHTHIPFYQEWDKGHFVNAGSVGKPKHGKAEAVYALLNVQDGMEVQFIDVEYDVEAAARAIEGSGLPGEFARMLRRGG